MWSDSFIFPEQVCEPTLLYSHTIEKIILLANERKNSQVDTTFISSAISSEVRGSSYFQVFCLFFLHYILHYLSYLSLFDAAFFHFSIKYRLSEKKGRKFQIAISHSCVAMTISKNFHCTSLKGQVGLPPSIAPLHGHLENFG